MAGWMEFRVCWWKGWLGRVVNMAAPDVPGPVKPGAYDSAANGGRRGASLKGGLGWGPDWISNWMEPKSFVVGKTRSGIWFLQFYIQRICTRTEEGLVAKSPLSSVTPPSLPPFTQTQPLKPISFKKYLPSHEPFIARMLRSPSFSDPDDSFSCFLSKEDNYVAIDLMFQIMKMTPNSGMSGNSLLSMFNLFS